MSPRAEEIREQLQVASETKGVAILGSELHSIAKRLEPFYGDELFRLIASLPERVFFPSGCQIESEIRELLGEKPLKGVFAVKIEDNERELVVSGQDPKKAKAGAEMLKRTLRAHVLPVLPAAPVTQEIKPEIVQAFVASKLVEDGYLKESVLAELEEFGEEAPNVLDALEDF